MALKTLMLKKQIDNKRSELAELLKTDFETREAELSKAIEEITSEEERDAVNEEIEKFESEKAEFEENKARLEDEIRGLEEELEGLEEDKPEKTEERRKETKTMVRKTNFYGMTAEQRDAFFEREDVHAFVEKMRSAMREKRTVEGVGVLIPEVLLPLLKQNIMEWSKLYGRVNLKPIKGKARQPIMGEIPEAYWMECCANLNELTLTFAELDMDCWSVGGFFAICNANIEDSDADLTSEILEALGQAIGMALDKAILYGRGNRMPLGIVTRLVQEEEPSGYPATARTWEDLTDNIVTIPADEVDADLFKAIVLASGKANGKYSRGRKTWTMNDKTRTYLMANALTINAAGAIVSGVDGTMPVVGGDIEVLEFIPDNVIIGGYFDLYALAERGGREFASSEHVRFLNNQTVFKGVARYDGAPAIAEGFVVIGINATTPTAEMTFAGDNDGE